MYSNKENVNLLTALLVAHGVRHAVVCPGSRNAPIVHNLNECPAIVCHAVTDERSAGFYALGMVLRLDEPVVVCVTSGSALLNVMPAIAEAHYQHKPLVVVSADRPSQWIDQMDGQTLPQPGVFGPLVAKSVTLPEPHNDEERWYCNRLVNEALLALPSCIHINVPISEPLFHFTTPQLPSARKIERLQPPTDYDCLSPIFLDSVATAQRPMIVFGQGTPHDFTAQGNDYLFSHIIVLHEALAPFPSVSHFDEVLSLAEHDEALAASLRPDVVIHVGGTIVSKRLKRFLRQTSDCQVWRLNATGDAEDTFQHLHGIVVGDADSVLLSLNHKLSKKPTNHAAMDYRRRWLQLLGEARKKAQDYEPGYSQMAVVRLFEQELRSADKDTFHVHYANSSAVRLANIYASHHVWCNRGVNGIEGSLSTAAGFSLVSAVAPGTLVRQKVFCVIGDLSFFYDQNALWNTQLQGNLRILLLNNSCGGIFTMLPGLEQSPAASTLVAAAHHTTAKGICLQHGVTYLSASSPEELRPALQRLVGEPSQRPMLLEVSTSADADSQALRAYYERFQPANYM